MKLSIRRRTPDLERHQRKCTICSHEKADEINQAYVDWEPIVQICSEYGLQEQNLYRHAKALEIDFEKLNNRKRLYLRIMERVCLSDVSPTEALTAGKLVEQVEGRISDGQGGMSQEDREAIYSECIQKIRDAQALPALPSGEKKV